MKTLGLVLLSLLTQTRSDSYSLSNVVVDETVLTLLPDGGCSARWCADVVSADGGSTISGCSASVELQSGPNITKCLQMMQAGTNKAAKALRFDVDAGAL